MESPSEEILKDVIHTQHTYIHPPPCVCVSLTDEETET